LHVEDHPGVEGVVPECIDEHALRVRTQGLEHVSQQIVRQRAPSVGPLQAHSDCLGLERTDPNRQEARRIVLAQHDKTLLVDQADANALNRHLNHRRTELLSNRGGGLRS
jgi:hypothetical protein